MTQIDANKSEKKVAKICFDFDLLRLRDPLVFEFRVVAIHEAPADAETAFNSTMIFPKHTKSDSRRSA